MPPEQRRRTLESAAYGTIPPEQGLLPFDYIPVILKEYGVTEAHTRPLVGRRLADDTIRTWRSAPQRAWRHELVEWTRTGHCYVALAFDLDEQIAIERVATANMGSTAIPCPNLVIYRKLTGHAHAIYILKKPVFRGLKARPFPIAVLARCSEWLLGVLHGDAAFSGVLVSNPIHGDYDTVWLRTEPYTLDQLRSYIPAGWRRPKVPRTDVGRNCDLFKELMRFAGVAAHSDNAVRQRADQLYQVLDIHHPHTYTSSELQDTVRSVLRYRDQWRHDGWNSPDFHAHQAKMGAKNSRDQQRIKGRIGGIRSGEVRRDLNRDRDQRILQYLNDGISTRRVAELEDLDHSRIVQISQSTKPPDNTVCKERAGVVSEATTQDTPAVGGFVVALSKCNIEAEGRSGALPGNELDQNASLEREEGVRGRNPAAAAKNRRNPTTTEISTREVAPGDDSPAAADVQHPPVPDSR